MSSIFVKDTNSFNGDFDGEAVNSTKVLARVWEKNRKEFKQVNFRVTQDEYDKYQELAKQKGVTVSALCRAVMKGTKLRQPKINQDVATEIVAELKAIGRNINQLAIKANVGDKVPRDALLTAQEELKRIWQQLA